MMKKIVLIAFLLGITPGMAQDLLDNTEWVSGTTGSTTNFTALGNTTQSSIITMDGPNGDQVTVWQAQSDGTSGFNGGFRHGGITLDTNKTYRFSMWVQSDGLSNCSNTVGYVARQTDGTLITSTEQVNGTFDPWPYFSGAALPDGKWYLVVTYIRPNSFQGTNMGGVYNPEDIVDPETLPTPAYATVDYKFPSAYAQIMVEARSFFWNCGSGEKMYLYEPRIDEINGQEPDVMELLVPNGTGQSPWNKTGNDLSYTDGNVGIGGAAQTNYRLAVDGSIHTREVKVDLTGWADYVFEKDYSLPTLEEVEKHIAEKGHLINIPSAEEVEANGIELGEMNRLLLEKIEELTLYIINQEKRIKKLENRK